MVSHNYPKIQRASRECNGVKDPRTFHMPKTFLQTSFGVVVVDIIHRMFLLHLPAVLKHKTAINVCAAFLLTAALQASSASGILQTRPAPSLEIGRLGLTTTTGLQ